MWGPGRRRTRRHLSRSLMGAAAQTRSPSARHAAATPTAPRGPQRAEAPGRLPHPGQRVQLRHLRAAAIGHLHPDKTVPRADRDRDRPARSARAAMPDTIAEQLAHQQDGVIPARMPGPSTPPTNARAPAPAPPARPPSRSPGSAAQPSAHPPFPGRLPPADHRAARAGVQGMHARLSGLRQAGTRDQRGPSVAVREPTVHTDRPGGADGRPLTCIAAVTQVVPRWPNLQFRGVLHCAPCPDCLPVPAAGRPGGGAKRPRSGSRRGNKILVMSRAIA